MIYSRIKLLRNSFSLFLDECFVFFRFFQFLSSLKRLYTQIRMAIDAVRRSERDALTTSLRMELDQLHARNRAILLEPR